MDVQTRIGLRIKNLRIQKGISQEKLAHLSELDRTYITGVENGKRNISVKNLGKIIQALDTDFKEFFSGNTFERE